jgi:hypothetical protein
MNTKSRTSRAAVAVLAALMAVVLVGCNGSGPSTTGPSAGALESATSTVVLSETIEEVEVGGQRVVTFSLPRPGILSLTVRWNDQTNSVVAVLTGLRCLDFRNASADCPVRRSIERQGKEGREQVINDPDASGSYRLLLENEGPGMESIRVTAELTTAVVTPTPPTPHPTEAPDRNRPNPRQSGRP